MTHQNTDLNEIKSILLTVLDNQRWLGERVSILIEHQGPVAIAHLARELGVTANAIQKRLERHYRYQLDYMQERPGCAIQVTPEVAEELKRYYEAKKRT